MSNTSKWTDALSNEVYCRLCGCRSIKGDILPLTQARWNQMKAMGKFEKEDALINILEMLDSNGCYFDLTREEYDDILFSIA